MSLSQVLDTLNHLFAAKKPLSSDWISVPWKENFSKLAGGYFKCLWSGRLKDIDRTGPGIWSPSPSSEKWPVGCLSSLPGNVCLEAILIRCTSSQWPCLRHHPGQARSHPPRHTHSYPAPRQSQPGFPQVSTGEQLGACAAQTCSFKPGWAWPLLLSFPLCQPQTMILTSFIRYFDIHWRALFPSVRIPNHAIRSAELTAKEILQGNKRLICVHPKACTLSRK